MTQTTDSLPDDPHTSGAEPAQESRRSAAVEGLVVALAPDYFEVAVDGSVYLCTARGRLRKARQPAAVSISARRGASQAGQSSSRTPSGRRPAVPQVVAPTTPARPTSIATGDHVQITLLGQDRGVIEDEAGRNYVAEAPITRLNTNAVVRAVGCFDKNEALFEVGN